MIREKFFKRSSYDFAPVYGAPPSDYEQKEKAEHALNNDMEVDQATSRGTSKDDPANPAADGPRNPRKADPQRPGSNFRKRLPWIIGGVAAMVLLAIALTLILRHNQEDLVVPVADGFVNEDKTFSVNDVTFTMKPVQGGTFTMGCTDEQGDDCRPDEKPAHSVTLSDFWMGETEVTQALWKTVMGTTVSQQREKANPGWSLRGEGFDYPMYFLSWEDCQEFIEKLNSQLSGQLPSGWEFALPTEAQWEYAARGGVHKSGYKYAGSNDIADVAWYDSNISESLLPVKYERPNALGLYDMSGNVFEWCSDRYDLYSRSHQTNPVGPRSGTYRVLRGGGWSRGAECCRVSARYVHFPGSRDYNFGFRLALVHQ